MPSAGQFGTLVVDLGGQTIKLALDGDSWAAVLPSGRAMGPQAFVDAVRAATHDWTYEQVSIGCPGPVKNDRLLLEPVNLGPGWLGFDLAGAFDRPVKLVNDAVMQALGGYQGGKALFLGLGTGLGTALVIEGAVLGLEVMHLPYRDGYTFEDFAGSRGLDRLGPTAWLASIHDIVARLKAALVADTVILGGGNAVRVDPLPPDTLRGRNEHAIIGGRRIWEQSVRIV